MSNSDSDKPDQTNSPATLLSRIEEWIRGVAGDEADKRVADHNSVKAHTGAFPGYTTVGASGEFDTLQAAWDDAAFGEPLALWLLPDYDPHAETYPVEFTRNSNNEFKPLTLRGPGPSSVSIGHSDVEGDVLSIMGAGSSDYSRPVLIQGVRFEGGAKAGDAGAGLAIANAPHSMLQDVLFQTEHHGLEVCAGGSGCYGLVAINCQAWNCGGDGFRMNSDAKPHNTHFFGCKAIANQDAGFRFGGGVNASIIGGDIELNHGWGVEARSRGLSIKDCYIEGNGRAVDYPVEVYGRNADGLAIRDCYFHGINPRSVSHDHKRVQRAVNLHNSTSVSISDCIYQRYGDRFYAGFKGSEAALHPESNLALDDTPLTASD